MSNLTPVIYEYEIDLASNNNFFFVKAVEGENNSRKVQISLSTNGEPYILDESSVWVGIRGTKPDNEPVFNACSIVTDIEKTNKFEFELTEQMLCVAGRGSYEIAIMELGGNDRIIISFPFYIIVNPSSFDASLATSSSEFGILVDTIGEAKEHITYIEDEIVPAENERLKQELIRQVNEFGSESYPEYTGEAVVGRVSAEEERVSAENERKSAEEERISAENERKLAEEERISAEEERISVENERKSAEEERISAENERKAQELIRLGNEFGSERYPEYVAIIGHETKGRDVAEHERDVAEHEREAAEGIRVENELLRKSAEEDRIDLYNAMIALHIEDKVTACEEATLKAENAYEAIKEGSYINDSLVSSESAWSSEKIDGLFTVTEEEITEIFELALNTSESTGD